MVQVVDGIYQRWKSRTIQISSSRDFTMSERSINKDILVMISEGGGVVGGKVDVDAFP